MSSPIHETYGIYTAKAPLLALRNRALCIRRFELPGASLYAAGQDNQEQCAEDGEGKGKNYTRPAENTTRYGRHTVPLRYPPLPDTQDVQQRRNDNYPQTTAVIIMDKPPTP